jgi:DNA-binding transcriptional LysR family regulator
MGFLVDPPWRPRDGQMRHTLDELDLVYRAAISGLGVAMGLDVIVEPYLDDGKLIRIFEQKCKQSLDYYVCFPGDDILRRPAVIFATGF